MKTPAETRQGMICLFLLVCYLLAGAATLAAQAPALESARQKLEAKDYAAAEAQLHALLAADSGNLEAARLLKQVQQQRNKDEAERLVELALLELDDLNFDEALLLLKESIPLYPDNIQAREMYISLVEANRIEEQSLKEEQRIASTRMQPAVSAEGAAPSAGTAAGKAASIATTEPSGSAETPAIIPKEEIVTEKERGGAAAVTERPIEGELLQPEGAIGPPSEPALIPGREAPQRDFLFLGLFPTFTLAGSNALDYIDSNIAMLGLKLDCRYYLPVLSRRLGISGDYAGSFLKISGEDTIKFIVHRMNVSIRYRQPFFSESENVLVAGLRLSYHLFHLQNLMDQGVYCFRTLYGPSFGLYLTDPVLHRFLKADFLKTFALEGEGDLLYVPKEDSPPVVALEFYLGALYRLDWLALRLGYRQYSILQQAVREHYRNIELGVGYTY